MARRTLADIVGTRSPANSMLAAPWPYLLSGSIIVIVAALFMIMGTTDESRSDKARNEARQSVDQMSRVVQEIQELLQNGTVQALAERALAGEPVSATLLAETRNLIPEVTDVHVYRPDVFMMDLDLLGDNGFILLDIMAAAVEEERSPVQIIEDDGLKYLAGGSAIGRAIQGKGFLVVYLDPTYLLNLFNIAEPAAGYIGLEHATGANAPVKLKEIGGGIPAGHSMQRVPVPGSMLQVVYPASRQDSLVGGREQTVLLILGALLLGFGLYRHRVLHKKLPPAETMPERFVTLRERDRGTAGRPPTLADHRREPALGPPEPKQPPARPATKPLTPQTREVDLDRPTRPTGFDRPADSPFVGRISQPASSDADELPPSLRPAAEEAPAATVQSTPPGQPPAGDDEPPSLRPRKDGDATKPAIAGGVAGASVPNDPSPEQGAAAVTLKSEIFRAYDIRGVVGKTLDRSVAYQIGQSIGSHARDGLANIVVVGRDGRHSGPELAEGLVEGLRAAGCNVIDIGVVPTGVLYWAAWELAKGTGVMVTGSHNPPDYNGFKIMVGGHTLAGDDIFQLFERIRSGNLRTGKGLVHREDVLEGYLDRIANDIQLARPLKVVADCGNGVGGVCAIEVLRAIGAEVIPLYEDVDGDFPNHHPDPSEPENLRDLIESVRMTGADLGLAFDGDADRLGVVTPAGQIVFADRVMMLYAREVLSRKPGSTIIYDVKCTGHLDTVIRKAGGEPEMYKTGHSLMKNRMKEIGAPLAGEMSGHFFFEDRWYGFDCGIYSACRLLEILATKEEAPEDVFAALPDSVSTPELKVHLAEGENHPFIERFKEAAEFPGARVSTIDGLRADFPIGWGLVRASNTTPILVLRFDAESEGALKRVQEIFREQLLAVKPDLELPF